MVFKNFEELIGKVKNVSRVKRVGVVAAQDGPSLEAVLRAMGDGLLEPALIGDKARITDILAKLGAGLPESAIVDEPDPLRAAAEAVRLVREGRADFLMKGKIETGDLLKAVVNKETGLGTGRVMSHMAIQTVPRYHKMLVTTDGGMLPYPTLEQKKDIIVNAVNALRAMGYDRPKVGVLAAVEKVNPKMPETVEAAALKEMNAKGEITGCVVEGPISMDIAVVKERAEVKGFVSEVAGDADILVVPDIHAGNILGKCLVELAGAKMAGLILGARAPIVVTSRGSSAEEKYLSLVLAAAAAG
ncbi:MAG TPA: bifunctional enoyl-CoA hydratase/phosphate acetyltransferase [Candidatus Aminicenantes bacterium]|nr:bifunctional enoyl-CoA hydratase/phosphate acetyltransferase [Candidatus Aminicenantes bacterium]